MMMIWMKCNPVHTCRIVSVANVVGVRSILTMETHKFLIPVIWSQQNSSFDLLCDKHFAQPCDNILGSIMAPNASRMTTEC